MENITTSIIQLAAVLGAITTISAFNGKLIKNQFKPLAEDLKKMDMNNCKCFLVRYITDIERGAVKDAIQEQLAYEMYDHYTKNLGGNSYIKDRWEQVISKKCK